MSDSINNIIDVAYQTEVAIEAKSTEQLTLETNTYYRQAEQLAGMSAAMLAEAGRRLIEVKNRIPHGEFTDWCEKNLDFSYRKAARMMQLAKKMEDENSLFSKMPTLATIEISRVWELLAAPEEVAAEVIETHDVTDMTVRELKEEIARIKEEKKAVENEKNMIEGNNDNLRRELASAQRKLTETINEDYLDDTVRTYEAKMKDLEAKLTNAEVDKAEEVRKLKEDLEKQKAANKRQKNQIKDLKAEQEQEIQKGIDAARADIEKKAKEEAVTAAEADLKKSQENIDHLEKEINRLTDQLAKNSNENLVQFKVLADQLQDIYYKLNDIITEQNLIDEEIGGKMQSALQRLIGEWRP